MNQGYRIGRYLVECYGDSDYACYDTGLGRPYTPMYVGTWDACCRYANQQNAIDQSS